MRKLIVMIAATLGTAISSWLLLLPSLNSEGDHTAARNLAGKGQGQPSTTPQYDATAKLDSAVVATSHVPANQNDLTNYVASLESASARQKLELLKDIAKQNSTAAASLSRALLLCGNLQKRHKSRQTQAALELATPSLDADAKSLIIAKLERELKQMSAECAGISAEEALQGHAYFEKAAELGDLNARAKYILGSRALIDPAYAFKHPEEVIAAKDRALRYTHAAAMSGSAEALEMLGSIHFSGAYPTANDLVKGTAYYIAAVQLGRNELRSTMTRRMEQLSATDTAEAMRLANDLILEIKPPGP